MEMLEYLREDKTALYSALRVNRTWFHAAASILWRAPAQHALQCVEPSRRPFYANKVTHLPWGHAVDGLEDLELPALRVLALSRAKWGGARFTAMLCHIRPHLEALECTASDEALSCFWKCDMRALRSLRLVEEPGESNEDSVDGFGRWLLARPLEQLQTLYLEGRIFARQAQLDQVLCRFAQHVPLQRLRLWIFSAGIQASTVAAITQARLPQPFRRLMEFDAFLPGTLVPALVRLLPSVTELSLVVDDASASLPAVAQLATLRSLTMTFFPATEVAPDGLLALRLLTQLRRLLLVRGRAPAVTPEHLRQLLAALPDLYMFWFRLESGQSSEQMLLAVGESCRRLLSLDLWGGHNISAALALSSSQPLFPKLVRLGVGRLRTLGHESARYVEPLLLCNSIFRQ
jgi:hypothetical protein